MANFATNFEEKFLPDLQLPAFPLGKKFGGFWIHNYLCY